MPKNATKEEADAVAAKMEKDLLIREALTTPDAQWPAFVERLAEDKSSWVHKTAAQLRSRSRSKGWSACLTTIDIKALLLRSGGRCEVTGLKFHTVEHAKRHPLAPSIDRIDSSVGYIRGNCRVVCYAANVAMNHWGEEMFGQIATGWVLNKYTVLALAHTIDV